MLVQWYPGHMNKARKMMETEIKLVDLVIEILDARAPMASRNPDIDRIAANKARVVILNKADLADTKINEKFKNFFEKRGFFVVLLNSKNKEGLRGVMPAVLAACSKKIESNKRKGIIGQPLRAMVAGIPNVGKSTFINAFCGRNMAKTGNKPGVTVGKQWIKVNSQLELLDTPGILWPKFDDQTVGKRLAYLGTINDEILVTEELAGDLLLQLYDDYPHILSEKYGITEDTFKPLSDESLEGLVTKQSLMLDCVAARRGCLKKGGEYDYFKAAGAMLEEFRSGRLGRISLEKL